MRIRLDVIQGRSAPRRIVIEAATVDDARSRLHQQGYTVLAASADLNPWLSRLSSKATTAAPKLNRADIVIFAEQLQSLLHAGLSVIEALDTLHKGARSPLAEVVAQTVGKLREGHPFSSALEEQLVFPPLLMAMVRSAEVTSDLPQALSRYLEHEHRSEQVRHQITSVALYPLLLIGVGGSVMLFLLLYVMPRFARVFESMNNLPWSARAMVSWSHFIKAHGLDLAVALSLAVAALASLLSVPAYRAAVFNRVLEIKSLARYLRIYYLSRWYRTTGMLVEGGIPLPESLQLAGQVLPAGLRSGGVAVEMAMRQGQSPSESYTKANMATPVAEQLLRAGERSGDVGSMLRRAAEFHEAEVTKSLDKAMRIIEPLVMTFIGLGVGLVVILMYLPIFELASAIQ